METIDVLKSNDLFRDLGEDVLGKIAQLTTKKTVLKNTLVIGEGDPSSSLYLILSGSVKVALSSEDGKEMIITTLQTGEHFGELSLLDEAPRSADITALEKSTFLIIHRADFFRLMEKNPMIAANVIKYLCQRVRFITRIAQSLALMDVYGRLVKLLYGMAETGENGKMEILQPMTRKEIASRIGSSREMVSRIVAGLEEGGYLAITKKQITINRKLPTAW